MLPTVDYRMVGTIRLTIELADQVDHLHGLAVQQCK